MTMVVIKSNQFSDLIYVENKVVFAMWASEAQNQLALTGNSFAVSKWANVNIQPCLIISLINVSQINIDLYQYQPNKLCLNDIEI